MVLVLIIFIFLCMASWLEIILKSDLWRNSQKGWGLLASERYFCKTNRKRGRIFFDELSRPLA